MLANLYLSNLSSSSISSCLRNKSTFYCNIDFDMFFSIFFLVTIVVISFLILVALPSLSFSPSITLIVYFYSLDISAIDLATLSFNYLRPFSPLREGSLKISSSSLDSFLKIFSILFCSSFSLFSISLSLSPSSGSSSSAFSYSWKSLTKSSYISNYLSLYF